MYFERNCAKCGQKLENEESNIYPRHPSYIGEGGVHMACADTDMSMEPDSRTKFNSWHIQKLRQEFDLEKASLRQRTTALLLALTTLMAKQGATQEEIKDIKYEFGFQDQPQDPPQEEKS